MVNCAHLARHPLALAIGLVIGVSLGFAASAETAASPDEPPTEHKGLVVEKLGEIPAEEMEAMVGLKDHYLQLRAITIEPGGQIARHSHAERPGLVKVVGGAWIEGRESGETEFGAASSQAVVEDREADHWFFNRGSEPATAIVCDLNPVQK